MALHQAPKIMLMGVSDQTLRNLTCNLLVAHAISRVSGAGESGSMALITI